VRGVLLIGSRASSRAQHGSLGAFLDVDGETDWRLGDMAYHLKQTERVGRGLRRLARKELRAAIDALRQTPSDEKIHEARKSLKKVRAIYKVLEADDAHGLRGSRKRLRRVNRTLSRLRDADAMLQTLAAVTRGRSRVIDEHGLARLKRRLSAKKLGSLETADRRGTWEALTSDLRKLRRSARKWRPIHRGVGALASGIRRTHRQGCKAMARAKDTQRASDFHEWRKQVKALWYELRLVEESSAVIRRHVTALHRAETALGDDHNLVLLCAELTSERPGSGEDSFDRLRAAAATRQGELRRRALARVEPLYRRRTAAFVREITRAWKMWRRGSSVRSTSHRRSAA